MTHEHRFSVYCECADQDCKTEIWVTLDEWDSAKSGPNRMIVVPGHALGAGEQVADETDRYLVVEAGIPPV